MTLKDAIRCAHVNKGHIYTTDELWEDDENCILVDSLGNLVFGYGEMVINTDELPQEGWYDATDMDSTNEDDFVMERPSVSCHTDVLWDENEMEF